MRSSKSRSRSKSNRNNNNNRSVGNIVNRVFDSSGPDGKVRGTPQQIIDKYLTLARDAQLSNDRVAAENFQQHAEHYARMLGEAQREQQREADARREREESQRRERDEQRGDRDDQQQRGDRNDRNDQRQDRNDRDSGGKTEAAQPNVASDDTRQPDLLTSTESEGGSGPVLETSDDTLGESGLVETPESKPKPRRSRKKPVDKDATEPQQAAE